MKSIIKFIPLVLLIISCNKTELQKQFSCNSESFSGKTEQVVDVKNIFSIQVPKHWKTNLFYDDIQSSIYFADTTKQLTETVLLDISQVIKEYNFNASFKKKLFKKDSVLQLNLIKEKSITLLEKPAYYRLSKGFKGKYQYQIVNIYIKQNTNSVYHIKIEVYGDVLTNQRLCKAMQLINTLELKS